MNKIFYALRKYNNKPSVFYIMNNDNIWWLESIMWKTGYPQSPENLIHYI